jgi:nuclear polyadenylated RNA-binding protein 3
MKSRGARVDVLMLSPRWTDEAVVRRQILEGVLAVVHLTRADRIKNKVPLRLFNRSGGNNNVSFDRKSFSFYAL